MIGPNESIDSCSLVSIQMSSASLSDLRSDSCAWRRRSSSDQHNTSATDQPGGFAHICRRSVRRGMVGRRRPSGQKAVKLPQDALKSIRQSRFVPAERQSR